MKSRITEIYVVSAQGSPLYKIGKTSLSARERVIKLQVGSPLKLSLVAVYIPIDGEDLESKIHTAFSDRRAHGEWFRFDHLEDPCQIIEQLFPGREQDLTAGNEVVKEVLTKLRRSTQPD